MLKQRNEFTVKSASSLGKLTWYYASFIGPNIHQVCHFGQVVCKSGTPAIHRYTGVFQTAVSAPL